MHEKIYKICWRVPTLMGLYGEWTKIEEAEYDTKEEAHEAMKNKADWLCNQLETTFMTKLKQYNYKMVEPEYLAADGPVVCRAVLISENIFTFESSPVGYLQVFEA